MDEAIHKVQPRLLFARQVFGSSPDETSHLVLAVGRNVAIGRKIDADNITAGIDVDTLAYIAMLKHGAIGKHIIKLERIAVRVLAKVSAVIVEGSALLVGFGTAGGLDAFEHLR